MIFEIKEGGYSYPFNKIAFENLNFSLQEGEVLCICGANGSGKSTLLQVMAGVLDLTNGQIISENSLFEMCALLFQEPDMQLLGQTVWEEMLITLPNPNDVEKEKALNLLKEFDLDKKISDSLDSLSFGQKRKLCLGASLMQNPKLLLLDEPSSALDYPALVQLRKIILDNKSKELAQCIVTHDIEFFLDIADKILLMSEGKQLFIGNVEEALNYIENHDNIGVRLPQYWKYQHKIMPW